MARRADRTASTLSEHTPTAHSYRPDIDGLRAIAVLAVVAFHFGVFPWGYLGVDVFFVISGYLITGIIHREAGEGRFSIVNFYLRRIRRILPLVAFICLVALVTGVAVMLPDDLENLAQSIVATIFFGNNILQAITVRNYWDILNEFKPLMHTWSLGVEEQYYVIYPMIFLALGKAHLKWAIWILLALTVVSLGLYLGPFPDYQKFYYLPFRFYELSLGGMLAILTRGKPKETAWAPLPLGLLLVLLAAPLPGLANEGRMILTVLASCGILAMANGRHRLTAFLLENPICRWIGLTSFSLYMWHQLVLAFYRYLRGAEISLGAGLGLFALMLALSAFSYYLVEQPFRNKRQVKTPVLLTTLAAVFLLTGGASFYLYLQAGVWRDVPELGIDKENIQRGMHAAYNSRIRQFNQGFSSEDRRKVLVIGNSLARDWANVLLESAYRDQIEVQYIEFIDSGQTAPAASAADEIFLADVGLDQAKRLLGNQWEKVHFVGYKNFGSNNGVYYNYRGPDYLAQRAEVDPALWQFHLKQQELWGERYIDLLAEVVDEQRTAPVFTPEGKFISQDTRHFTQAGARYFAERMEDDLARLLELEPSKQK